MFHILWFLVKVAFSANISSSSSNSDFLKIVALYLTNWFYQHFYAITTVLARYFVWSLYIITYNCLCEYTLCFNCLCCMFSKLIFMVQSHVYGIGWYVNIFSLYLIILAAMFAVMCFILQADILQFKGLATDFLGRWLQWRIALPMIQLQPNCVTRTFVPFFSEQMV